MKYGSLLKIDFRKIHFVLLSLIAFTLPFFTVFNSFLIILLAANFFFAWLKDRSVVSFDRQSGILIIFFSSIFLIYFGWVIGTGIVKYWFIIEKKFSLFIFPLILGSSFGKPQKKELDRILTFFLISLLVSITLALVKHPNLLSQHNESFDIDSYLVMRRPYMGLYTLFGASICIYFTHKSTSVLNTIALIILAVFLAFFSYLIYVKMAIIGFLISGLIAYVVYLIYSKFYRQVLFLLAALLSCLSVVFFVSIPFQEIVKNIVNLKFFDFSEFSWIYFLSINMRYAIWSCCYDVLAQGNNWLLGAGLGHQSLLDSCYVNDLAWDQFGVVEAYLDLGKSLFNAHNQWLQIWLDCGVLGPVAITVIVATAIRRAMRQMNFFYLFFTLFFFACCITESMLEVQRGIVFYALFNSFFAFNSNDK